MEREKLIFTKEEAELFAWEAHDHRIWEVISDTIYQTRRWSEDHEIVIKRLSDGKFFKDTYSKGLTEQQDESPWEYSEPNFTEVFPKKVEVIVYE